MPSDRRLKPATVRAATTMWTKEETMLKVAINGFGRIGRSAFKVAVDHHNKEVDIVGINDLTDAKTLAHLLKYDTAYGIYNKEVTSSGNNVIVDGKKSLRGRPGKTDGKYAVLITELYNTN